MRPKAMPVWKLAKEAGVDVDTVLLAVWEFVHVDGRAHGVLDRRDKVPPTLVEGVRKSLGIATRRQLQSVKYWTLVLGLNRPDFAQLLTDEGYAIGPKQQKLPPGAKKFLMALARNRNIDPLTGAISSSNVPAPTSSQDQDRDEDVPPPPSFEHLGRRRELRWLTVDEVQRIHNALVRDFARTDDPIDPPGVRNDHLIASAVSRPQTGMAGILKYPTVETSAAALLCALIHNHPFHNGNKRTALVSTLVYLDENGLVLTCSEDELFRFVLLVAKHKVTKNHRYYSSDYETLAAAEQICKWSRGVSKAERTMTFLKLRPILEGYGCTISIRSGRAFIVRERPQRSRSFFGRRKLQSHVFYRDDGTDVPPDTVRKIRRDLQLDHEHGYDEFDFYSKKPLKIDGFIARYRKTLMRLGKL
ncbi:MAG: type II toxin-antitoxin system death-on-curing family toxin [Gemmatimonadetes bacterium]|nr:type II toxin-antitoxin system death-on-curing family toxin [Gemmatimonadota bacterium]MYE93477.1 type II toxin-antitoxin system death-on-curing family toxin [Gemmatimonadota bacterium]MYJ09641.1 type II toxin-antitoxin system death-on-curing family toxin [Gemmatimonadota bacterium]